MNREDLLALYDQQLRIEIEIPGMRKETFPGLVRFVRPAPGMNFIQFSRLEETEVDAVIQEQIDYYLPMEQPFEWKVCDHDLPSNLKERLMALGFAPDDDPDAVMVLDLEEASPALLEPVQGDVRLLTRREQLDDVVHIEEQVLGGSFAWLKERLGNHLEISGYLNVYAAYVEDRPVSAGWIFFNRNCQFASLYGGSTVPEMRKRGLYTSLVAVRAQEAIRRGYRFLITGASPMSRPILQKIGFTWLTTSHGCEWQPKTK